MTQTNTTQNGNAINRIIERTDEITKRELSGNDPSYKIGDNPNEFYQNGTLPVQNASTQPTTQNKEELIKDWKDQFRIVEGSRWTFPSEVRISWEALKELVDKSIQQAHQSGIEEGARAERVKIAVLPQSMFEEKET